LRTLIFILVLILASAFGYASIVRVVAGVLAQSSIVNGEFIVKGNGMITTLIEPVISTTLDDGTHIKIVVMISAYDETSRPKVSGEVATKVIRGIINCEEPQMFIGSLVMLDIKGVVLLKDLKVDTLNDIQPGSTVDVIRKHVCVGVVNNRKYI